MPALPPSDRIARGATLLVLAAGLAATLALNLPGHLSYDSVVQLLDGRTGRYHTWHPPFMAWLLGLGDSLLPGTALYVCAQTGLVFAVLAWIIVAAPRVRPWAPLVALALVATPHLVLWQGIVWKDVLFADLMVAGFVTLAMAFREGRSAAARWALVVLAFVLLGAAALPRQNGLLVPLFGAAALAWAMARRGSRPVRVAAASGAVLGLTLLAAGLATVALNTRSIDGSGAQGQLRSLEIYDLAGALAREPRMPLGHLPPAFADTLRTTAAPAYTPRRLDPIQGLPDFPGWGRTYGPQIDAQWRELVTRRPLLWLRLRSAVFGWMIAPPDIARCNPEMVGVDGDPAMMAELGLKPGWRPHDLALARYAAALHATPLYAHWLYALGAAALAVLFLRSRAAADAAYGGMMVAALAFTATFAVIGVACDYRYLYALDLSVLVAGFRLALGPWPPRRGSVTKSSVRSTSVIPEAAQPLSGTQDLTLERGPLGPGSTAR